MHCMQCGADLKPFDNFCRACGQKKVREDAPSMAVLEAPAVSPPPVFGVTTHESAASSTASRLSALVAAAVLVVVGVGWLYASPYVTLWRLQSAVMSGDAVTAGNLVEWDALRTSVKREARTVLQTAVQSEATSTDAAVGAALVGGFSAAVSDALIDKLVTQENVSTFWSGSTPDFSGLGFLGDALANGVQTAIQAESSGSSDWKTQLAQRVSYSMGYLSFGQFALNLSVKLDGQSLPLPVGRVFLTRSGLGWNVSGVQFGKEVLALVDAVEKTEEAGRMASNRQEPPQEAPSAKAPSYPTPQLIESGDQVPQAAPSFNCEKATTAYEKLACTHPDLAEADRTLAAAYRDALASHPLPTYVRERQRVWMKRALDYCAAAENPVNACLDALRERTVNLSRQPFAVYTNAEGGAFNYKASHVAVELFPPAADGLIPISLWGGAVFYRNTGVYTECDGRGTIDTRTGRVTFDKSSEIVEPIATAMGPNASSLIIGEAVSCVGFAGIPAGTYPAVRK